jgi:hypothetical protein
LLGVPCLCDVPGFQSLLHGKSKLAEFGNSIQTGTHQRKHIHTSLFGTQTALAMKTKGFISNVSITKFLTAERIH